MSDELDFYRLAGEIFGRLKRDLGFGELSMSSHQSGIHYAWTFNAKKRRYAVTRVIARDELTLTRYPGMLAESIVAEWKSDARRKLDTESEAPKDDHQA